MLQVLSHALTRYRSLSKPRDALLSDEYLTLHELLAPLYYRPDFEARIHEHAARAIELLDAVNPDHVTPAERDALEFELPKLRLYPTILAKEAFERLMGLVPPRHSRHHQVFTHTDPLTPKLEHLCITLTLERLRGTELGVLLYEEPSRRVKPKRLLRALQRSSFAALASEVAHELPTVPVTAQEAERVLFPWLNQWTSRELVARPGENAVRAERIFDSLPLDAPVLVVADLPHTYAQRTAHYGGRS